MKKWYYYTGTINNGNIVNDEPVGVFEGEGEYDDKGTFWVNKNGGQRNYHDYFDSYEDALAAYTKSANSIVEMYLKRSIQLLAPIKNKGQ